ncbi:MAG TPA: pre-peptidase C-terminal domain-containing protein [Trichocoleus sp.]|jgi:tetratricopeptide (TPR) repeat protein
MSFSNMQPRSFSIILAAIITTTGGVLNAIAPAQAQQLQEQGSLQPMQQAHKFSGKAGEAVTISLDSSDFDTYMVLVDPSGKEVASNDDYARTMNSTIVITLPQDGEYQVLARSFSGAGGQYNVNVRPATAFDQAYWKGVQLYSQGQFQEAEVLLTQAIELDPTQPAPYLDRAEVAYAQGNLSSVIADYQKAATLYEQAGNQKAAQDIRAQIGTLQGQATP